jgi:hypothetical protein
MHFAVRLMSLRATPIALKVETTQRRLKASLLGYIALPAIRYAPKLWAVPKPSDQVQFRYSKFGAGH